MGEVQDRDPGQLPSVQAQKAQSDKLQRTALTDWQIESLLDIWQHRQDFTPYHPQGDGQPKQRQRVHPQGVDAKGPQEVGELQEFKIAFTTQTGLASTPSWMWLNFMTINFDLKMQYFMIRVSNFEPFYLKQYYMLG